MSLSNSQYDELIRTYDARQLKNQHDLEERIRLTYLKVPRLREIDQAIASLSVSSARKMLDGNNDAFASYQEELNRYRTERAELLRRYEIPEDYLKPSYMCPDCKDTGYQNNEPCHCLKNAEIKALYESSNLMDILNHENFDTFDDSYYDDTIVNENLSLTARQNIRKVKTVCLDYIKHFDDSYDNLIFYGSTGVGKTFLTHCIAKKLLDTSHTVLYLTSLQLFDILERNKFRHEDISTSNEQIAYMLQSDLLIIDDLGAELVNGFTSSQLYYFIEERHINHKSTIISTNLSFQELRDRYSERIFSRFIGFYHFFLIIGDDIRQKARLTAK